MNNEHGAFFDLDYLLASCMMETEQKVKRLLFICLICHKVILIPGDPVQHSDHGESPAQLRPG